MLFDKELFAAKYVEPDKRVKVDTLVLIGNGFDIWQGLNTSFRSFEKYYEEHLEEVLRHFHLKSHTGYDKEGKLITDEKGTPITYSDVELFYGNPFQPAKLSTEFWGNLESSMDKVDDQQINYFFGRDGVKDIKQCADNAQRVLKEIFRDWVMTIEIEERNTPFQFGDNVLFVNFNYTDTLCKRFGVNPVNEFHIHGSAQDKESILVGHATHPEYPYEPLRQIKETPRLKGLYYIEDFLYNADKHVEDNYTKLRIFCALHGAKISEIENIYVLGLGLGDADLSYIKNLIYDTQGISENPEKDLTEEEIQFLDAQDYWGLMNLNIQYAISHRERVMRREPISFPEYELLDEIIKPYVEDPYHHMKRDSQMRLEAAAVRRRFWSEQQERNEKMEKEYLRMLKKKFHVANLLPYINLFEEKPATSSAGAKWHISYFSEKDKKRIEEVMKNYGCGSYTLYPQIDQCIEKLDLKNVTSA